MITFDKMVHFQYRPGNVPDTNNTFPNDSSTHDNYPKPYRKKNIATQYAKNPHPRVKDVYPEIANPVPQPNYPQNLSKYYHAHQRSFYKQPFITITMYGTQ
jgi:hypothetical protein